MVNSKPHNTHLCCLGFLQQNYQQHREAQAHNRMSKNRVMIITVNDVRFAN